MPSRAVLCGGCRGVYLIEEGSTSVEQILFVGFSQKQFRKFILRYWPGKVITLSEIAADAY
jgi:hypothetical protein